VVIRGGDGAPLAGGHRRHNRVLRHLPPVTNLPGAADLTAAGRTIIMGERDQLIEFEASKAYAASIDARFIPISADHFFYYREARVAAHVVDSLGGP